MVRNDQCAHRSRLVGGQRRQGERSQVGGGPLWHDSGSTAHPDGQVADAEPLFGIFLAAAATGWA
ncbi:hypothetical protein ACFV5E_42280 [Streptomyces chartreusis]|uniref:hypothetical protein n=1 Tax=Streptomyces chartreusis TaxID=1969 RepID=UPI00368B91BB